MTLNKLKYDLKLKRGEPSGDQGFLIDSLTIIWTSWIININEWKCEKMKGNLDKMLPINLKYSYLSYVSQFALSWDMTVLSHIISCWIGPVGAGI